MSKVVIVTGANGGIGKFYSKEMLKRGYHVVLACRNKETGLIVLDEFQSEFPNASVELMIIDMGNLSSIEKFAKEFKEKHKRLDVLTHNAGVYFFDKERKISTDGIELNFAVHYIGLYALTAHLFDILKNTSGSKVINMSSGEHHGNPVVVDDIQIKKDFEKYGNTTAYSRSKWATLSFSHMLGEYIKEHNLDMHALGAHPGISITGIQHKGNPTVMQKIAIWAFGTFLAGKPEDAALPLLMASTKGKSGEYYGPTGFKEMKGKPGIVQPDETTKDEVIGKIIWDTAEQLTGISFH